MCGFCRWVSWRLFWLLYALCCLMRAFGLPLVLIEPVLRVCNTLAGFPASGVGRRI